MKDTSCWRMRNDGHDREAIPLPETAEASTCLDTEQLSSGGADHAAKKERRFTSQSANPVGIQTN